MSTNRDHFRRICVPYMALLRADFPMLSAGDAAAVFGNFGHESGGLQTLQEIAPVVKGSRGGYGWPQWTGTRRRAYEAYCKRTGKDPASEAANYAFVFVELKTTEKHALAALTAARSLNDKVIAFERAFLRAGIKHYPSRQRWAGIALEAYQEAGSPIAARHQQPPVPRPPIVRPGGASVGLGAMALAALAVPLWAWLLIVAMAVGGFLAWPRRHAIATHLRIALGKL